MEEHRPSYVERVPQVFSIGLGACAVAVGAAWDTSRALAVIPLVGAAACLFLRLWIPIRRRRKYGY